MQPESAAFIWDALEASNTIGDFLSGISRDDYANDLLRRRAVEREFEIIGEALNKLRRVDVDTADRIPGLQNAVSLRNVLIHGYAQIDDGRVYDTVIHDLPELIEALDTLLDEAGAP